jgi:fused signal recognition particle receptor
MRRHARTGMEAMPATVLDAMTGQEAVNVAKAFQERIDFDGVVLTKLDGSAKGGVAIPIAYELGLPVKLVGVGEALEDLQPFDPRDYARALVDG